MLFSKIFKKIDFLIFFYLVLFFLLGQIFLYSAAEQLFLIPFKQSVRFALGLVLMFLIASTPSRYIEKSAPILFLFCFMFLVLVHFFGTSHGGAKRWLNLFIFEFQPSELLKIALPLMVAWIAKNIFFSLPYQIAINLVVVCATCFLIASQPDLGTSILIGFSGVMVLLFANISKMRILLLGFLGLLSTPFLWSLMKDYQKKRVLSFLNPEQDPLGAGYHVIQSKIAIGSGGIFGKGYLNGTQSSLDFLPEPHTDFIFSVIAEEFGLFGVSVVLALYLFLFLRCIQISLLSDDLFQKLLAVSLSSTFFLYVIINVGMVSGLFPVVGVPLPLLSYGGTSVVTMCISFGILMSIKNSSVSSSKW